MHIRPAAATKKETRAQGADAAMRARVKRAIEEGAAPHDAAASDAVAREAGRKALIQPCSPGLVDIRRDQSDLDVRLSQRPTQGIWDVRRAMEPSSITS